MSDTAARQRTWSGLETELQAWRDDGRVATLWWRDDDAETCSAQLTRLCALAKRFQVPLCLAVIPRDARDELAHPLAEDDRVMLHGWAHVNHAPVGEKACELGRHRPVEQVLDELRRGRQRLRTLFGERFLPALVPPWNRIHDGVVAQLPQAGLDGLSTFAPRRAAPPGLRQVNAHVDPILWRQDADAMTLPAVLHRVVEHLQARRLGRVDAAEPTGLLTHHLQHDERLWALLTELLARLAQHRDVVRWLDGEELFGR
jgi:hypothetical protein